MWALAGDDGKLKVAVEGRGRYWLPHIGLLRARRARVLI
jgi:hypothetical protein